MVDFNEMRSVCESLIPKIVLGKDEAGKKVFTNLKKVNHLLVCGEEGSCKEQLLNTIIASLLVGLPYTGAELFIIDINGNGYQTYKNRAHITVERNPFKAMEHLERAEAIMERRIAEYERFVAEGYSIYDKSLDLHPIVIIIDDLTELINIKPSAEWKIRRIIKRAKDCGVHLIVGVQPSRYSNVEKLAKTNISTVFTLPSGDITGKCDVIYRANGSQTEISIHSATVDDRTKRALVSVLPVKQVPDEEYQPVVVQRPRRMGLFGMMRALWNVKPIMFVTDEYPPRI